MGSANIFTQYAQPVRSIQDYSDDIQARQMKQRENALAALLMQEKEQGLRSAAEDRSALQTLASQYGNDAAGFERALTTSGRSALMTQGQQMAKARADAEKARADAAKTDAETKAKKLETVRKLFTYSIQALQTANDPQTAEAVIARGVQDGAWGMEQAQSLIQEMRSAPDFNAWRAGQLRAILDAEKQLPKVETRNRGGVSEVFSTDPVTGQVRILNSAQNTVSPDAAARIAEDRRQFGITEARQNATAAAQLSKPFEVTGPDGLPMLVQQDKQGNLRKVEGFSPKSGSAKPLTEGQAKALLFGSRAQEADKILKDLDYSPLLVNAKSSAERVPLIGGALGAAANVATSSNNQRADQAQRDFINAVLRRESGAVISDGEFDNARKQYFPQPGDSKAVLEQKAKNRALAVSGILAEVPEGRRASITPSGELPSVDAIDAELKRRGER